MFQQFKTAMNLNQGLMTVLRTHMYYNLLLLIFQHSLLTSAVAQIGSNPD